MKNIRITLFTILCIQQLAAQVVKGNLTQHKQQQISLTGFDYYRSYELGKTTIDSIGNFAITYPKDYVGMAILKIGQSSTILILNKKQIELEGTHLMGYDSLNYKNSFQNNAFLKIAKGNALNDQAYAGSKRLLYKCDPYLFVVRQRPNNFTASQIYCPCKCLDSGQIIVLKDESIINGKTSSLVLRIN